MKKVVVDLDKCSGCRTCEIACAYHHTGQFSRKGGSIYVGAKDDLGSFGVLIYDERRGKNSPCDLCAGEAKPLCVKYCHRGAIQIGYS
jgi:Fe-S-cluster-containing hydrogenase component 2